MKCEWHNGFKEAAWWADTIFGPTSWCCDECLQRVGKKDDKGKFIAIPAAERLAKLHPAQPGACGVNSGEGVL